MGKKPKIILVTQARTGSRRLPKKVLKKIQNKTLLEIHLNRLKKSKKIDMIVVATTNKAEDNEIEDISRKLGITVFKGSENNVLDRYYQALKNIEPDWLVRVTSDCPLIDGELIDEIINIVVEGNYDYGSNTFEETYPDGQDIEVMKFKVLETAWINASKDIEKEHVTPYIKYNSDFYNLKMFKSISVICHNNFSKVRMTVDEINDFDAISILIDKLGFDCNWEEYANFIISNLNLFSNQHYIRNEGYLKQLSSND